MKVIRELISLLTQIRDELRQIKALLLIQAPRERLQEAFRILDGHEIEACQGQRANFHADLALLRQTLKSESMKAREALEK